MRFNLLVRFLHLRGCQNEYATDKDVFIYWALDIDCYCSFGIYVGGVFIP